MSIQSVMSSNHRILCCFLLLLPSIFLSIRVFSKELALCIRWPQYWSFPFSPTQWKKKRTTTLAPGYFWAGNSGPLGCWGGSRRLGQHPRPRLAEDALWPLPPAPTLDPWRQPWIPCLQKKGRTWRNMAMKWRCSLTLVNPVPTSAFFFYLQNQLSYQDAHLDHREMAVKGWGSDTWQHSFNTKSGKVNRK